MALWRPFHALPCLPAFQPHRKNVLVCPPGVLAQLKDESALRLRQREEDLKHDREMRKLAGKELVWLEDKIHENCAHFRKKIQEAEEVLSNPNIEDVHVPEGVSLNMKDASLSQESLENLPRCHRKYYWIAACDPPISFMEDFRGEFVDTMYNITQTWSLSFGQWYNKLKRLLYTMPRWKRVYKITHFESLTISQDLLMGVINATEQITVNPAHYAVVTDLEVAACILAAYQGALEPDSNGPATITAVLKECPRVLKRLAEDIGADVSVSGTANAFMYKDKPNTKFYTPTGGNNRQYPAGTFNGHAIMNALIRRKAVLDVPFSSYSVGREVLNRVSGKSSNDLLTIWTRRLLGDRFGADLPSFIFDQDYLRSGLTAVMCLLLLWRVLNSDSVFSGRAGHFSLRDIFPDGFKNSGEDSQDSVEEGFRSGKIRNFEFLLERYVIPFYEHTPSVTISQLFPGFMLLAYCESHRSGWNLSRPMNEGEEYVGMENVGPVRVHSTKQNPLVDYMMLQSTKSAEKDLERLASHDYVLFHCENGLGRFLSLTLPKHRVLSLAGHLFNVQNVYELLYFFVLGFLPVINVT